MTTEFRRFRGRLAQFRSWSNKAVDWENRWSDVSVPQLIEAHVHGDLGEFEFFTDYLPRGSRILEAGCGLGQLVMALSAKGYTVDGVDYSHTNIERAKTAAPFLNVRVSNVYDLDVPNGTYTGYLSIGVFEHNPDGPTKGLKEARRVLHPHGFAFISVPYLNAQRGQWLRQARSTEVAILPGGLSFYQYYFSRQEFEILLRDVELEVVQVIPYAVYAGLTRDFALGSWLHGRGFFVWRLHRRITQLCKNAPMFARWRWAHMLMFVCKPAI